MGKNPLDALRHIGIDEETAYAPEIRVPLQTLFDLWSYAVEVTGNPAIGVLFSVYSNPAATVSWPMPLSLLEHVGMATGSLEQAVSTQARFTRLLRDHAAGTLTVDGELTMFRLDLLPDEPPALVEHMFAVSVNLARRVARRELAIQEVWFTHAAPQNITAHQAVFRAPIRFSAPVNAVLAPTAEFRRPLPQTAPGFRGRIVRHAEKLLADLPDSALFEASVCARIEAELPGGNTNSGAVAEKLGVSGRTLHRRLRDEGTSYQELLDRVRLQLSVRHLSQGKAIAEVAGLVGFSQASTFHRAFKGWTGETPTAYQQRLESQSTLSVPPPAHRRNGSRALPEP